jgi:hypothetical protein
VIEDNAAISTLVCHYIGSCARPLATADGYGILGRAAYRILGICWSNDDQPKPGMKGIEDA